MLFFTGFPENTIDYTKTLNIGNINTESYYFSGGVGYANRGLNTRRIPLSRKLKYEIKMELSRPPYTLQRRHNERHDVSNQRCLNC